jgi:microsomal epoxide hydrolase
MTAQPFKIEVPQATLDKIMTKVRAYEWPDAPEGGPGGPWAYGSSIVYMKDLVEYWQGKYDWRKAEAGLNRFPQFKARVRDLDIHYVYEKGSNGKPRPIILSHGWPGSFFEFMHVIEPLAHPERFGGKAEDGFDVVVPSLPGYGFSSKPKKPIGPRTVAGYFETLMTDVLKLPNYIAQGGDWGSSISGWLAYEAPNCKAAHLNMNGWRAPGVLPQTDEEKAYYARAEQMFDAEGAYFRMQSSKPLTLSYALMDSPVGVCAWIVEKFKTWSHLNGEDIESAYTKDQLLTNVMIYLVTGTFATSTWLYRGLFEDMGGAPLKVGDRITKPVAVANFPHDFIGWPPRSIVEKHLNVAQWTDMGEGGHFAAMEKPKKFIDDVRSFARQIGL